MSNQIYYIEGIWKIVFAENIAKPAFCMLTQTDNTFAGVFHRSRGDLLVKGALNNDGNIVFTADSILGSFNFFGILNGESMYGIVYSPGGKCRKNWTAIKVIDE